MVSPWSVRLGDLLLDVVVRLDGFAQLGADATARTRTGAAGKRRTSPARVTELGGQGRSVAKNDAAASLLWWSRRPRRRRVRSQVEGLNGVVVSIVAPTGERTMNRPRRRASAPRRRGRDALSGCGWLYDRLFAVPARRSTRPPPRQPGAVRGQGGRISVDLSSWSMIRDFGLDRLRRRLELLAPDVSLGNAEEPEEIGGSFPAEEVPKLGA